MSTIPIEENQHDLIYYLRKVEAGETFVITRGGEPVAEIKPVTATADAKPADEKPKKKKLRPYGLAKGEFVEAPDFDDPLPEEFLRYFTG